MTSVHAENETVADHPERLLSTSQAAAIAGVVPETVRLWIHRDGLPVVSGRWGRRRVLLVRVGDLERFLAERGGEC